MQNSIWSNLGWMKREIKPRTEQKAVELVKESKDAEFPVDSKYEDMPTTETIVEKVEHKQENEPVRKSRQQIQKELLESYNKSRQLKFIIESKNH